MILFFLYSQKMEALGCLFIATCCWLGITRGPDGDADTRRRSSRSQPPKTYVLVCEGMHIRVRHEPIRPDPDGIDGEYIVILVNENQTPWLKLTKRSVVWLATMFPTSFEKPFFFDDQHARIADACAMFLISHAGTSVVTPELHGMLPLILGCFKPSPTKAEVHARCLELLEECFATAPFTADDAWRMMLLSPAVIEFAYKRLPKASVPGDELLQWHETARVSLDHLKMICESGVLQPVDESTIEQMMRLYGSYDDAKTARAMLRQCRGAVEIKAPVDEVCESAEGEPEGVEGLVQSHEGHAPNPYEDDDETQKLIIG